MGRNQKEVYCLLSDDNKKFYKATEQSSGGYSISFDSMPKVLKFNPSNLLQCPVEFATNSKYMSMVRSISFPLSFIEDGAAILRYFYYNKKNINQNCYLTIIEWNGELTPGRYELTYYGKIDLSEKEEDPKSGTFTVPVVDDSAWGILSRNDTVQYAIDCSPTNPKAIPVLLDSVTLKNNYTYQTVSTNVDHRRDYFKVLPLVLVNQDGDSSGILTKNQSYDEQINSNLANYVATTANYFFVSLYPTTINISGDISFITTGINSNPVAINHVLFTSKVILIDVIPIFDCTIEGKIYNFSFNIDITLDADEKLMLIRSDAGAAGATLNVFYFTKNIIITTKTYTQPVIAYGLRSRDLLIEIVSKATRNRFTIDSDFLSLNNKDVCLSGDSIRGIPNSKIYTSFADFFKTFDSIYFLALRVVNGNLFLEQSVEVYKDSGVIIDLGEAIDLKLTPAKDYYCNEIVVGSSKQDYRHPSGRLEFNSENTFSLNFENISKKETFVSKYRMGCYDIVFLILDYKAGSTQDNSGDKSVYVVKITDDKSTAIDDIETFENFNVNNSPLAPIIKSPLNNTIVTYNKPTIRGISKPGDTVFIYVDTVLDGSTIADINGNWTYEINTALSTYVFGVSTGIHVIDATFSDLSAPVSTITLNIDTSITTVVDIYYPQHGSSLYNNKPLIKGTAPAGTNIDISLNGSIIGSVVTNNSCLWEFKSPVIPNGNNTLSVNLAVSSVNFDVDTNIDYPLITNIGSELDGFILINNLPLIEGVSRPFTNVTLWLNYISYIPIGTALSDANGNWSFQCVPTSYIDPLSGLPVIIVPIRNGINVLSTSLVNHTVGINVRGYKLSRPLYSSITGVIDNTIFNTEYSPKRMLEARFPILSAMFKSNINEKIYFQTADKNGNLRTVLGAKVTGESDDVPASSMGNPMMLLEKGVIKTAALNTFAKTLYNFSNGGTVKVSYRGNDLYFLPIGNMKMDTIVSSIQEWNLIMSTANSYQTLLNLYKQGLTINLMQNRIYHSDYNTLHFVKYNFQRNAKYNQSDFYEDWFNNRNDFWLYNPKYIQKIQTSDPVIDQIITNGISGMTLKVYRCIDAVLIDTIIYNPVSPAPINPPEIVMQAVVDVATYPAGQYFCVQFVNETPVAISERFETRVNWPMTVLIESSHSKNKVGAFFSTGWKSIIRLDGIVKKVQPDIATVIAEEESGGNQLIYSQFSKKREVRFGKASGEPDFIYIKVAMALLLNNLLVNGVGYTLNNNEKIEKSEDIPGVPMFYYNVLLDFKTNETGLAVAGDGGNVIDGVILVVDSDAVGLPSGSLINIELT